MDFKDKKAVIFDLDGTLLDTLTDLQNGLNAALIQNGRAARTRDEVRAFVGNGLAKLVERALPDGRSDPDYDRILSDTRTLYAEKCNETTKPYEGIPELLSALCSRGYLLAVVSNKPDAQVKSLCRVFFPGITVAVGQREGFRLKPAPDSVLEAIRLLGCETNAAVYAGDSEVDIDTAAQTGIPCISVLWGFRSREMLSANGAGCFAATPAEMLHYF